jgi:hypothetical protein
MATPTQINSRHGDESQAAHRSNKRIWVFALAALVVVLAAIAMLSRAPTGPGANSGRVANDTANVQGGVAPGVGATYANQPGGTADGTPPTPAAPAAR